MVLSALAALLAGGTPGWAGFEEDLAAVVAVGPKGKGAAEAAEALGRLSQAQPDKIIPLFAAFEEAGPVGRNLLAGAVQSIADRAPGAERSRSLTVLLAAESPHPEAAALAFD
ncbi:hypothetical protein, partial [Alienimonas chondri]|uniref:hypothetical protein n=1 Tax=Alienimonas chondri TaxID=2681879 RepID=UPI001489DB2D